MRDQITFDEFKKLEIRIGKVLKCERVEDADKLLKLQVDFGSSTGSGSSRITRQIVSGIAESFAPEDLVGRSFPFIVNLEHRKIRGEASQGMILAMDVGDSTVLLEPSSDVAPGTEVV